MQRHFSLQPSRLLAALLIASHGIACAALLPLALPLPARIMLTLLVLLSLGYHLWRDAWLAAPSSVLAFRLEEELVTLALRNGNRLNGKILGDTLVTPWLTVLIILPQGARLAHSVLVLPDSMDMESFRKLRVLLKWNAKGRHDAAPLH